MVVCLVVIAKLMVVNAGFNSFLIYRPFSSRSTPFHRLEITDYRGAYRFLSSVSYSGKSACSMRMSRFEQSEVFIMLA
jgi:hypothetical protein